MPTLYDILGVSQDASGDELRHAYYRAARRLHPDLNRDVDTTEGMLRLNQAWAVLGDSDARRAYDVDLHRALPDPGPFEVEPVYQDAAFGRPGRFVRPSALIVAVLLVIFVVTAYAGPRSNDRIHVPEATVPSGPSGPSGPSSGALVDHMGQCLKILPGYDAVVPCPSPNDGQVVAEVGASAQCPTGTRPYQLAGMVQIVCLEQARR